MIITQQENQTETILHHLNMLQMLGNLPRSLRTETTLNSKYVVDKDIPNAFLEEVKKKYSVLYYGIGKNGFKLMDGLKVPYRPENIEMDLYEPIPFRCVRVGQSLNEYEKDIYRLPVPQVINNEEFICYYLKKIKLFKTEPDVCNINSSGIETAIDLSNDGLFPVPNENNLSNNIAGNIKHRSVKIEFNHLTITSTEQQDLKKYFFDNKDVVISELGLYSGYDEPLSKIAYNIQLAFKYCNTGTTLTGDSFSRNIKLTYGTKLLI